MHVSCANFVLAPSSSAIVRPPCSGSSRTPVSNAAHVHPASWYSQGPALFLVILFALVAFPASVSAAPRTLRPSVVILKRQGQNPPPSNTDNNNSSSDGNINMSVWLPILLVTVVFVLFSFITCVRRCAAADAAATTRNRATDQAGSTNPAGGNTTRPRRRPHRTPSQISTKSLPPYMKEPGDQELVLFRGPSETEDEPAPPPAMPTLTEDDDERPEMRGATFDIALDRIESVDTMANASTTNLIRRMSGSVPRPPELPHPAMSHDHRRSEDAHSLNSVGSEAELLATRGVSVDNSADPRGEAPSYLEAVSAEGRMTTISLNDPEPNSVSSNTVVPPSLFPGRRRPRFSFLMQNPFSSHDHTNGASSQNNQSAPSIRSESPAQHARSGSALSRFSTRESHDSHHSRTPSRNNNLSRSHSRSNSNLFRAFRSHSPGLHGGSSMISLESISAPLTHTATRAEFYAPKGGLMTAEQIKLITSREALEKFGAPYGADAVAAYSRLAGMGPPPDFESVTEEHREQPGGSGNGGSAIEATEQRSDSLGADTALPRSTSPSQLSTSHRVDERAGSRASTDVSYETAPELDGQVQIVQTYASGQEGEMDGADEPPTARPMTPRTIRPLGVSRDHGRS